MDNEVTHMLLSLLNTWAANEELECSDSNEMLQNKRLSKRQREWLEKFEQLWDLSVG